MTGPRLQAGAAPDGRANRASDLPLILHLVTDLRRGGAQTILLERVRTPGPFRHAVLVFALHTGRAERRGAPPSDLIEGFREASVPVHSLDLCTAGAALRAWGSGSLTRRLDSLPLPARPALVHSTLYHTHLLGDRIRRLWKIPHLASKESLDLWMRPWHRRLEAGALRGAARVAAVSRAAARSAAALGVPESVIRIIPNGLDPSRPGAWSVPAVGTSAPRERILGVGRAARAKGWEDLLAAVACLLREGEPVHLDLIVSGSAPDRERLAVAARRLGVADRVRIFAGESVAGGPALADQDGGIRAIPADPEPSRMPAAASHQAPGDSAVPRPLLVVPSREEGFGLILLEGMARGLPIVATSAGGIPEVVRDQREALLVPPRNPPELARAVRRVLKDPALAQSLVAGGRSRLADFPAEAMVRGYHDLYREILAE